MSGISTGVGLLSGINHAQLIEQLMAIEARPLNQLRLRMSGVDAQKTAYLEISAKILAAKNASVRFKTKALFQVFSASSSKPEALTATASSGATPGTFTFRVRRLVTNSQLVSRGFADANQTPVGAGTLTFELGKGKVNDATELSVLNGGQGVRRGSIKITDRSGASTQVDLSFALTLEDVVAAINAADGVNVRARVTGLEENGATGDRLVIEDLTGATTSDLIIDNVGGGFTATDLGIAGRSPGSRRDGRALLSVSERTSLSFLSDGNGVGRFANGSLNDDLVFEITGGEGGGFSVSLGDFLKGSTRVEALNGGNGVRLGVMTITTRDGQNTDVDLAGAKTVQEVIDRLNNSGAAIRAQFVQSHLLVTDESTASGEAPVFKIADKTGNAAADLGILATKRDGATSISGRDIYRVQSLGDVVRAIQFAEGNDGRVTARVDGKNLVLETSQADVTIAVRAGKTSDGVASDAAADLGILDGEFSVGASLVSRDLIGGLNTVLLRNLQGGAGVGLGQISFMNRSGASATVDLAGTNTLQDVIDVLNRDLAAINLSVTINAAGSGLRIVDASGGGGQIQIKDVTGSSAVDLGIAVNDGSGRVAEGDVVEGGNVQRKYIASGTLVSSINQGQGIMSGEFTVTAASGRSFSVTISTNGVKTVGQAIERINSAAKQAGVDVLARINDTGDGILLEDRTEGTGRLTVTDEGGTTARDLRLAGTAKEGQAFIDGTFETRIDIAAGDTLNDVAAKINATGGSVTAAVVNTGGSDLPFTLTLSSKVSGRAGDLLVDAGGIDLGLQTLIRAQDAILTYGDGDNSVLITSSSNTLENVIPGVTLNLLDVSEDPVTLTVSQDVEKIVGAIQSFVDAINGAQSSIGNATKFNSETLARGVLFGDSTVSTVRARLTNVFFRRFEDGGDLYRTLSAIGLSIGTNHTLEFDADKFREAYAASPQQIEALFTNDRTGLGDVLEETFDGLTDEEGVIPARTELLDNQKELFSDRIDALTLTLDGKRARLERQFLALETSLAQLQRSQNALIQLQALAQQAR